MMAKKFLLHFQKGIAMKHKELDEVAKRFTEEVRKARGHKQGIRVRELGRKCGINERDVRDIVAELVLDHGWSIGTHPTYGIFMIIDREDLALATRHLKSRGVKILRRLAALEKTNVSIAAVQLAFWNEKEKS
jgi:hypothetical protein